MGRKEMIAKARQTVKEQADKMKATASGATPEASSAAEYLLTYGFGDSKITDINPKHTKAVSEANLLFGGKPVPPEYKDMKIRDIITKLRLIASKVTAAPTTDAQGTPEIGGAPADESVEAPVKKETPEGQIASGDAAAADASAPAAEPAKEPAATPAAAPTVQIADDSAVALVKIKDTVKNLNEDIAIKKEVIKEVERMLSDAGVPVSAMQKVFDARASYMAGRLPASEVKRHLAIVAKAEKVVEAMSAEADLAVSEVEELAGIKASLATAIEKAQDSLGAVAENKPGDHRAAIVAALRDIELSIKEYGYFKKLLALKDSMADSIVAIAQFIEEKKIAPKADEIVAHFDRFVSMGDKERNSVKALMVGSTPGFAASASISTVAAMTPHAAKDPIAEIEELGMKLVNGERKVERVS